MTRPVLQSVDDPREALGYWATRYNGRRAAPTRWRAVTIYRGVTMADVIDLVAIARIAGKQPVPRIPARGS